jgi:hypothetical protein
MGKKAISIQDFAGLPENLARSLRLYRAVAVLALLLLVGSALATLMVVTPPTRATSSSAVPVMSDDFTQDTSLNASLWQINGSVGTQFGTDEVCCSIITLVPTFSSRGMMIDQINGSSEVGTIQSIENFTPPFTATAMVEGTVSNGHTFGFAISSADAATGVVIYGNLNPQNCSHLSDCGDPTTCGVPFNSTIARNQCFYGIDGKVGSNGSRWLHTGKLYLTPSVNVVYKLQISVDASGNAQYAVSQGGQVLGMNTTQVGKGPFWIILEQAEGTPVERPGPNQAYWLSVSLIPTATTFSTTSSFPTTSSFSTASTSSRPTTSGIHISDWLIIIVVVILLLIILLWYRRRNLTIKVKDAGTLSPVIEAVVSADGPEKLRGYTDKDGKITLKSVKKGDYSIKAEAKGYVPSTPANIEVKKTTEYEVKLDRLATVQAGTGSNASPGGPGREVVGLSESKPSLQVSGAAEQTPSPRLQQPSAAVTQPVQQGSEPAAQQPIAAPSPSGQHGEDEIEGFGGGRIGEIIKKFQTKGAISPETALTAEELGLSRLFVRIMKRRKGRTRIFVEINGRYYLDRKALKEAM